MGLTYEITGDEVLVVKVAVFALGEDVEVLSQRNQAAEEQRNVRSDEAKWSSVRQLVVGDTLSSARTHKEDVRNQKRDPGQQTKDGSQVDEIPKDNGRVVGNIHECGAAEQG